MRPVGQDPRWEVFAGLHAFLKETFPLVHARLNVTTVNTYNLVMHWQGNDLSRKPVLIIGHQDVVPVDPATLHQWEHPPYSGHYDGTWLWGRGSCDDKGDVISTLLAMESLLEEGFQPERTIVLAFGIDEESSGKEGADKIYTYLNARYGRDSFAVLLDEGSGYGSQFGEDTIFVVPSTSEKGYLDALVEVTTPGGSSAIPPPHTVCMSSLSSSNTLPLTWTGFPSTTKAIGILSSSIVALESHPHAPQLHRTNTAFTTIQCTTAHDPRIPQTLRDLAHAALTSDSALEQLKHAMIEFDPTMYGAMLRTTQAVDLVGGGVRANALPERAWAVVNLRIAEHSSVREVQEHLVKTLQPVAERFGLEFKAFGKNLSVPVLEGNAPGRKDEKGGMLRISDAFGTALEPSPPTPLDGEPYKLLAGTVKATLRESKRHQQKNVIVSPVVENGNTDTRAYWNLTRHIFRYTHLGDEDMYNGLHTVNEAVRVDALLESIQFLTMFILNWDEAD
ncbi:hypothetical protein EIP91_012206 [Steccherinum ochraceum]|uniref:Uncharacterized protein n=1 Tax=Steccherinum ochraceum TaxID=92696 RepID=A0A4R0RJB9_9APHY|nr:hypothetical protein EIP91_012206 [Steccherinum ochraceum]